MIETKQYLLESIKSYKIKVLKKSKKKFKTQKSLTKIECNISLLKNAVIEMKCQLIKV
jgi:hypothetical protein